PPCAPAARRCPGPRKGGRHHDLRPRDDPRRLDVRGPPPLCGRREARRRERRARRRRRRDNRREAGTAPSGSRLPVGADPRVRAGPTRVAPAPRFPMPDWLIDLFARYGYAVVFFGVFLENTRLPVPGEAAL